MFGRKRKQEQELDGLGLPVDDGTGLSVPPPTPSVSVAPSETPPAPPPAPAVNFSGAAALAQIFSGQGPVGEMIAQIKADPVGFRNRMLAQAQAAGVSTFVITPQGMSPIGHPPSAPVRRTSTCSTS